MKRIIALTITILMLFTNFCFAVDVSSTANYLEKQKLDEWGILALYSSGKDVSKKSLSSVDSKVITDYEKYILGARAIGKDVSSTAQKIIKAQSSSGRFSDYIDGTGNDLLNGHIWAVIALYVADEENYNKDKALSYLKSNQNSDGGFPIFIGDKNSDLDMTAMGLVAYNVLGLNSNSSEVKKGFEFIEKNIDKKESCETIAWYILAKVKFGLNVDKKYIDKLLEYRLSNGSFKHLKSSKKGNYMATYHGLLALNDYNNKSSIFEKLHNLKSKGFKDLKQSDYAYKEIMYLVDKGVVSGYSDKTFKPNNSVKRGEFAKFLVYGLGLQSQAKYKTNEFTDLKNHWANKVVNVAVKKGYINGIGNKKFAPEDKITGAQVAAMVVRAKGLESKAKAVKGKNWYDGYVKVAKDNNLLYKNFNPNKNATRAQCAEIIYKLVK
ncbi:S-layer homology domain-containing protein [Tepidibacter formicigenes]|uniref:S-layer homology domain-containing protein n=1 Tax=Tepidibacter formicigenes DSM 15518 TaxID=1123349 RepID=A0A1M6QRF2_9FIRM|nr:S-layer homology domain-containing protein [Tepidibacter formicigenes]SHK22597.1 S-layer homology domain-containing protein [Tepidibacter formicigenes DSM 15518]